MAYKTVAAIYVGSSEIAMTVFEVNGRKSFRQVDCVKKTLELGKDTYRDGVISRVSIDQICEILNGFKKKMKEYQVSEYRAYATSAVREAGNTEIVLDAIKRTTNFHVQVLSNSEQRFINFKGLVAQYGDFHQVVSKNTAFVDVGAGSVQVSLFDKNNLVVTENIPIGAVRVRDYLALIGNKTGRVDQVMADYVQNDIVTFRNIYLNDKEIKNVIAVGEAVYYIKKVVPELEIKDVITRPLFDAIYKRVVSMPPQALAEKYGIPYERVTLLLPSITIYQSFLNNCKAEELYVPNVDFCVGIIVHYMDEGSRVVFNHNFEDDILATAYSVAKRYRCNRNHVDRISDFALKIFDAMKKRYSLDKKERLQLHLAAILHECGNYINLNDGAMNSYYIVANTEILGISHKERMEVANMIRYNTMYLPSYDKIASELGDCDYIAIGQMAAILRIANVLDKSHTQKIEDISVTIKDGKMVILAKTYEDLALEAGLFESRADFFEQIFGIRPILRVKRSV